MTTKQGLDQEKEEFNAPRAVWLARAPAGARSPDEAALRDRRFEAHRLARRAGAQVVGEFISAGSAQGEASDRAWAELLEFLQNLRATTLVVLRLHEIARGFSDYYRRTESLEHAGVRLVLPDGMELFKSIQPNESWERAA